MLNKMDSSSDTLSSCSPKDILELTSASESITSPGNLSRKQLKLCLSRVKTPTHNSPKEQCIPLSLQTHPPSPLSTHSKMVDILDLLNEDPLNGSTAQQHQIPIQTSNKASPQRTYDSSQSSSNTNRQRQTDLLSFLDSSYPNTSASSEHTPLAQSTDSSFDSAAPRTLFPGSPLSRKRKLSVDSKGKMVKKRKVKKKENMEQLQLDCGQKLFGHVTCKVCGMVYTHGQMDDQVEHSRYHTRFVHGVKFPGWKRERVVESLDYGRIIMVLPTDSKQHLKKIGDIQSLVDIELGFSVCPSLAKKQFKVFLCISQQRKLMGCAFTEEISQGYEVLSDGSATFDSLSAWFCSTEPQPATVGINRLWVSGSYRRMGVASRLLDTVRSHFIPGLVISKDKVAFTDPTPDGKIFASRYCERTNFLVYR